MSLRITWIAGPAPGVSGSGGVLLMLAGGTPLGELLPSQSKARCLASLLDRMCLDLPHYPQLPGKGVLRLSFQDVANPPDSAISKYCGR